MRSWFGSMPTRQRLREAARRIGQKLDGLQHIIDDDRLEHVEFRMTVAARYRHRNMVPMTWAQTMVIASHCVGLTLPGMIEEPGSFSGSSNSPMPERGPEPIRRISLAIFIRETARTLSMPESSTNASCGQGLEFVLGRHEIQTRNVGYFPQIFRQTRSYN